MAPRKKEIKTEPTEEKTVSLTAVKRYYDMHLRRIVAPGEEIEVPAEWGKQILGYGFVRK